MIRRQENWEKQWRETEKESCREKRTGLGKRKKKTEDRETWRQREKGQGRERRRVGR